MFQAHHKHSGKGTEHEILRNFDIFGLVNSENNDKTVQSKIQTIKIYKSVEDHGILESILTKQKPI